MVISFYGRVLIILLRWQFHVHTWTNAWNGAYIEIAFFRPRIFITWAYKSSPWWVSILFMTQRVIVNAVADFQLGVRIMAVRVWPIESMDF